VPKGRWKKKAIANKRVVHKFQIVTNYDDRVIANLDYYVTAPSGDSVAA